MGKWKEKRKENPFPKLIFHKHSWGYYFLSFLREHFVTHFVMDFAHDYIIAGFTIVGSSILN